ncbi:hypothetical protein BLNAU_14781 [Blattamonas nauphoetae]|uniref:Uncharacterized protein n=1 Tax=Blattamonas nauphoetae TaxID=2049346 RepID=A0ABQ9XHH0_9EUKA|nr:hypothetical protein BLNAU_14781 [Blattamonas nauphoetae]
MATTSQTISKAMDLLAAVQKTTMENRNTSKWKDIHGSPSTLASQTLSFTIRAHSSWIVAFRHRSYNGRFLQVPIKLMGTMFIFDTARETKQSIKLILDDEGCPPPEWTKITFGDDYNADTTVFIVVDESCSVELFELKVDWEEDWALCQLVGRTASMSILGCEIKITSVLSFPLIACQADSLVISDWSFWSFTSDTFNHLLVLSGMPASSISNSAQNGMIVELSGVEFTGPKMKDEVGVVELNDADHVKQSQIVCSSDCDERMRLVENNRTSSWIWIHPPRHSCIDALSRSLDRSEEGLPFHTPTLLVYLSKFTAPMIHIQSTGKDFGRGRFTSRSGTPVFHDNPRFCSTLLPTRHFPGSDKDLGEWQRVILFVLSPGRSTALLQSTSGTLIVADCSFSKPSELESELVMVVGGKTPENERWKAPEDGNRNTSKMSGINPEMQALIGQCHCLNPDDCPTLSARKRNNLQLNLKHRNADHSLHISTRDWSSATFVRTLSNG